MSVSNRNRARPDRSLFLQDSFRNEGGYSPVFSREDMLAKWMTARVETTLMKGMRALGHCYLQDAAFPQLSVGGARYQRNTGDSGRVRIGAISYLTGTQAAHLGLGSFRTHGRHVSDRSREAFSTLREKLGIPEKDIQGALPDNTLWLGAIQAAESATWIQAAFINQVEAKIERLLHKELGAVMPANVPTSAGEFRQLLQTAALRIFDTACNPQLHKNRINRVSKGELKQVLQYPKDTDPANLIFDGQGLVYLDKALEQMESANSEFTALANTLKLRIPAMADETIDMVMAAKTEAQQAAGL